MKTSKYIIALGSLVLSLLCTQCSNKPSFDKPLDPTGAFVHPGIINTEAALRQVERISVESDAYIGLLSFIEQNPISDSYPDIFFIGTGSDGEGQMRVDAILAYAYALKWVKTGRSEDVENAVKILNGWGKNFLRMEVQGSTIPQQVQLQASWVVPSFAAAAEIIRNYRRAKGESAGWAADDIRDFSEFLLKLDSYIDPLIIDIMENGRRLNNWGTSAGYAKMAIGVFLESEGHYNTGKDLILYLLPKIIEENGEVRELCSRDCHHPQYSMSGLTYAAEIARIQRDESIYRANNNRLEVGWEWISMAFSGNVTCRDCSRNSIFPAVEIAAKYYSSADIRVLNESKRPHVLAGQGNTFLGFTTLTHFGE